MKSKVPPLAGLAEAAEILNWDKKKVGTYLKRARERGWPAGSFPEPTQRLASGPIWTVTQIEEYRDKKK